MKRMKKDEKNVHKRIGMIASIVGLLGMIYMAKNHDVSSVLLNSLWILVFIGPLQLSGLVKCVKWKDQDIEYRCWYVSMVVLNVAYLFIVS